MGFLVLVLFVAIVTLVIMGRKIGELFRRIGVLERSVHDLARAVHAQRVQAIAPDAVDFDAERTAREASSTTEVSPSAPVLPADPPGAADERVLRVDGSGSVRPAAVDEPASAAVHVAIEPLQSDAWSSRPSRPPRWAMHAWHWLTHGNVPVKVGMLVLFAGVAALLKYVADQGWLTVPLALRLAAIGVAAVVGLAFGWHQRARRRSFALSLQGGAIGVLLMTVFAAFRLYGLLPAGAAFALCVLLVLTCGVLALAQNTRSLAVLGILAGFLSPVLMSTGQGDHVALFSWYAVLNAAIFAIAWRRAWRELNLLGFVFTFGIGVIWGVLAYRPELFASTWPFLALFFGFYLAIPVLNARQGEVDRPLIDGSLVFGNPLLSFAILAGLLEGASKPLAMCAIGLAALYLSLAWMQRADARRRTLMLSFVVLGVGFATLAVPLALSASATACLFALEGAALIWLGLRQQQVLPRFAGAALQGLSALAWLSSVDVIVDATVIANARFVAGGLLALAGFVSAACYHHAGRAQAALGFYLWGLAWWLVTAGVEIAAFASLSVSADLWLALLAFTVALAGVALGRLPVAALAWTIAAGHVGVVGLVVMQVAVHDHPFAGYGAAAWVAHALLGAFSLRALRRSEHGIAALALAGWLLAWTMALAASLSWLSLQWSLAQGWAAAITGLPWLVVAALLHWRPGWITWPLLDVFRAAARAFLAAAAVAMALLWLVVLPMAGDPTPLPWVPLFNPLELMLVASLVVLLSLLWSGPLSEGAQRLRLAALVAGGFLTLSSLTLRSVHHLGGVPWSEALLDSALAQASLSLVWSVLGVLGWVIGSRRGHRLLWTAGAVLMAVVLAKLVLVDRGHLGNLLGIVSFIGYGLLCTAVGYLAPAPPRDDPRTGGVGAV